MELEELLATAVEAGASDIHLTTGTNPVMRVNGKLTKMEAPKLDKEDLEVLTIELLEKDADIDKFRTTGEVDFGYTFKDYHLRVNAFHQKDDPAVSLRILPKEIPQLDELGLPSVLREITEKQCGLFLVTGATGSGKSTTLASMIDRINRRFRKHIITLEDPIEYVHHHKQSIVNQREVGRDTEEFLSGLRSALRQDPDIILVGEMRDLETISTAITAAETGHLVLATLHTNGAAETIERIINVFPPHKQIQIRAQLSLSLQGVLSQKLLPNLDRAGRVVATELMIVNSAIENLIREGKTHQIESVIQTGKDSGMHTLEQSLRDLFLAEEISKETAFKNSTDRERLENMLGVRRDGDGAELSL